MVRPAPRLGFPGGCWTTSWESSVHVGNPGHGMGREVIILRRICATRQRPPALPSLPPFVLTHSAKRSWTDPMLEGCVATSSPSVKQDPLGIMGLTEEKWGHLASGVIKFCDPHLKCCTAHLKPLFAEADNNCHLAGICAEQ